MRFHHIGYAVQSIEDYYADFMAPVFGPVHRSETYADPTQKVAVCFVTMQGGVVIELVEPLGEDSPVRNVVGSKRGGVYHLCYEVEDLKQAIATLRRKRCFPLGPPTPAVAFAGRPIVFLMSPYNDLIELVQA